LESFLVGEHELSETERVELCSASGSSVLSNPVVEVNNIEVWLDFALVDEVVEEYWQDSVAKSVCEVNIGKQTPDVGSTCKEDAWHEGFHAGMTRIYLKGWYTYIKSLLMQPIVALLLLYLSTSSWLTLPRYCFFW
jgi:hypothetical protein